MRKIIEKIKGKGVKLSGRIFGALTACLSTIVAAYADAEEAGTGGVWSSVLLATQNPKNAKIRNNTKLA